MSLAILTGLTAGFVMNGVCAGDLLQPRSRNTPDDLAYWAIGTGLADSGIDPNTPPVSHRACG